MGSRRSLQVGGALCLALVVGSCRVEFERTEFAPASQPGGWTVSEREAPPLVAPRPHASPGASEQAGICEPGEAPVTIVVVKSASKVRSAAALWESTPVVAQDSETVVFADGRIVTSRLEATGEHLESLGWAHRDIEIVGSPAAATAAWQRRRG